MSKIECAFDNISAGRYYEGFVLLEECCRDNELRSDALSKIIDIFYTPNLKKLRSNYCSNKKILMGYPYFFCDEMPEFDVISTLVIPVDGKHGFLFKESEFVFREIEINSDRETKYFYSDLSKPVFVEDETNSFNLQFLADTVRASDDVATDNHVYLYYPNVELFYCLMQLVDFVPILKKQKFVFLIGKKNRCKYPIDFKKDFGIDYSKIETCSLRIEEMKRLCYWSPRTCSGTIFACGVLAKNPHVIDISDYFNNVVKVMFILSPMKYRKYFLELIKKANASKLQNLENDSSIPDALLYGRLHDVVLHRGDVSAVESLLQDHNDISKIDLLRAIAIVQYAKKSTSNARIVPIILFDLHMWCQKLMTTFICNFSYNIILSSFRDPIVAFARFYERTKFFFENKIGVNRAILSDYVYMNYIDKKLHDRVYAFRFEDLKQYPDILLKNLCGLLNIPYNDTMLSAEASFTNAKGEIITGFDKSSLSPNIDDFFSELDIQRLKLFYAPIIKHYGYNYLDTTKYDLKKKNLFSLLKYPFRFEKHVKSKWHSTSSIRRLFHSRLKKGVEICEKNKYVLPILICPETGKDVQYRKMSGYVSNEWKLDIRCYGNVLNWFLFIKTRLSQRFNRLGRAETVTRIKNVGRIFAAVTAYVSGYGLRRIIFIILHKSLRFK